MHILLNASELKTVFHDIKPILKGMGSAALLGFTVEQYILSITCSNGILYEQQLVSEHPGPYALTVLYQDLSELLPGRGTIELDLAPMFVGVRGENLSVILPQANGIVACYRRRCENLSPMDPHEVKQWVRCFSETAPVAKSLQREVPVIFQPPYALMKFPTFWLQVSNRNLEAVLSLQALKAVAEFAPIEFGVTDEVVEFRRGAAVLAVARNHASGGNCISDLLQDHPEPLAMPSGSYLSKIQQLLRSVGPGPCRCQFYQDGFRIVVNRPNVQSQLWVGECKAAIASLSTVLEYVQMVFKLCGETTILVSAGKHSVCLRTQQVSMLLSTQ